MQWGNGTKFGLLGAAALILVGVAGLSGWEPVSYRSFYIPSESMLPTLRLREQFVAEMRQPESLRRGMLVLVEEGETIRIIRVAALAGDRIAMEEGRVVLNGTTVQQRRLGTFPAPESLPGGVAVRHSEQFPGEPGPHEILDVGTTMADDMEEQLVAPGHVFVLGDNRDHSADSRFGREQMGLGQVRLEDVRGVPIRISWSPEAGRMGTDLTR